VNFFKTTKKTLNSLKKTMKNPINYISVIVYTTYVSLSFIFYSYIETLYDYKQKKFIILFSTYIVLIPFLLYYKNIRLNIKDIITTLLLVIVIFCIYYYIDNIIGKEYIHYG
jgi:hypothetical protein